MCHFTFGKFKDRPICDVFEEDPKYIVWITKQKWFKQKFTMEHKECLILMNNVDCPPIQSTDINDNVIKLQTLSIDSSYKDVASGRVILATVEADGGDLISINMSIKYHIQ